MSQGLVERQNLEDIADAIRSKNGSTDTYTPAEMAQAISEIQTADEVVLVQKTVNANGQYNASSDSADGYSGVRVNVPNSYSASDEGKVVSNGDLMAQTTKQITANGTHDTTTNNSVAVNVPNSYAASDNGKVVVNQELVAQTSKNINANGTHDTTANNSVVVDVPNSYAAVDEGKVVSGGALVGQTSRNVTMNGTYDTTENNEVVVNVEGGGSTVQVIENIIPAMTSNNTPKGIVSASSSLTFSAAFAPYQAFNRIHVTSSMQGGWLADSSDYTPYIQYEFGQEYSLYGIKIWTANNGETATREVTIEGRINGSWVNVLQTGQTALLTFTRNTYGETETEHDILLNEMVCDAIKITGNDRFYLGSNMTACTFAEIEVYAYEEITSHSDW